MTGSGPMLKAYTNAVVAAGSVLLISFAPQTLRVDPALFAGLLALAIVTSVFKLDLRLSHGSATMTLGYAVGFLGLLLLGPHATAVAVSAGIWTQCTYQSGLSMPMDLRRRLFSVAAGVLTVEAAGWVFGALGGQLGGAVLMSLAVPLAGAALVYFLANTALVAGAIALSTGQKVVDVWQKNFLLSGPSYFISAAIVGVAARVVESSGYLAAVVIGAPLFLTFLAYRAYLGRIAEEQEHVRIAQDSTVTDVLTGLPNRTLLIDRIERSLAHQRANPGTQFAVLFLDLDGFKIVNDCLGHQAGDQLLQAVAKRLHDSLRQTDQVLPAGPPRSIEHTLARLGGDEFIVLLHDVRGQVDAMRVAERLQAALVRSFQISGRQVHVTASAGIALGSQTYHSSEEVLRDADTAMYRAKTLGKARAEVFDASMRERVLGRLQLDTDLRLGVERHEFLPYYQPVIDLATGRLSGFEALLRWQHPERGVVEPGEFISVMEENGLIVPVGRRFFSEVCRQVGAWQAEGPAARDISVNVNFSGQQFLDPGLVEGLLAKVDEAGIDPSRIVIEITESSAIGNFSRAVEVLEHARDAGFRIVLDDFGTGYSSLSCLHELPISGIKLHRSFMARERRHPEVLKAIVTLAGQLGLTVTAEGVETVVQCEQLKHLGCDQAQGYLFARPVPAAQAGSFISQPPASWLGQVKEARRAEHLSKEPTGNLPTRLGIRHGVEAYPARDTIH